MKKVKKNLTIYDSTLRDGAQTRGLAFGLNDKIRIAEILDNLKVDYIEAGWPGANPTDDEFFKKVPKMSNSKIVAFGMTRKNGKSCQNDPGLNAVLNSGVSTACIVGKAWDFHVKKALGVSNKVNLDMIGDSIHYSSKRMDEIIFDAEHFFDGYKSNPKYSLKAIQIAFQAGAKYIVLCDTNGGTLPFELKKIISDVQNIVPSENIGVHFHNDSDLATANSLEAIRLGVGQVQGTFNGLGERCGNVNLVNVIANVCLKMGIKIEIRKNLKQLTNSSKMIDEILNRTPSRNLPFVGSAAFAHKGGLHISAVEKDPKSYEHIDPKLVGNERTLVVSNQSGKSNIISQLKSLKIKFNKDSKDLTNFVKLAKHQEYLGFAYDGAEASFELLALRKFKKLKEFYILNSFKVSDEKRISTNGVYLTLSEARIKLTVKNKKFYSAAEGNGPIHALDNALRQALIKSYPKIKKLNLLDYKVRILTPREGTDAQVRVRIESTNGKFKWSTIGVSKNVIDASFLALNDSFTYHLLKMS